MSLVGLPPTALGDVETILDYYLSEAGVQTAERFLEALSEALLLIDAQPGIGSPRLAIAFRRPSLRVWPVRDFPYLICYHERNGIVEVWRIVHTSRNIPRSLRD